MITESAWKRWLVFETWSAHEAVALLLGIDPDDVDETAMQSEFEADHMGRLERYFVRDRLMTFSNERGGDGRLRSSNERHPPKTWIASAIKHGFNPPYSAEVGAIPQKQIPRENKAIETVAALLALWPGGKIPSGKELEEAAQSIGLSISDDTIRKVLKAATDAAPLLKLPK